MSLVVAKDILVVNTILIGVDLVIVILCCYRRSLIWLFDQDTDHSTTGLARGPTMAIAGPGPGAAITRPLVGCDYKTARGPGDAITRPHGG